MESHKHQILYPLFTGLSGMYCLMANQPLSSPQPSSTAMHLLMWIVSCLGVDPNFFNQGYNFVQLVVLGITSLWHFSVVV